STRNVESAAGGCGGGMVDRDRKGGPGTPGIGSWIVLLDGIRAREAADDVDAPVDDGDPHLLAWIGHRGERNPGPIGCASAGRVCEKRGQHEHGESTAAGSHRWYRETGVSLTGPTT